MNDVGPPAARRATAGRRRVLRARALLLGACLLAVAAAAQPALADGGSVKAKALLSKALPDGQVMGTTAISKKNVWLVGNTQGATAETYAAHWNGRAWKQVKSPNPEGSTGAYLEGSSARGSKTLWAAGYYSDGNGASHPLTMRHRKGGWQLEPAAEPGGRTASSFQSIGVVSKRDAWAVGNSADASGIYYSLAEQWNGTSWQVVPTPNPDGSLGTLLTGVTTVSSSDAWATGAWLDGSGVAHSLAEHWDGEAWTIVPTPDADGSVFNILFGVDALSSDDVWAVGYYDTASGAQPSLVEHWDGSAWTVVPSGNPQGSRLTTTVNIDMVSDTDGWIVGNYTTAAGDYDTLTERWDGSTWSVVSSPNQADSANYLWGVSALSGRDVWAGGYAYALGSGAETPFHLHWNGHKWKG